MGALLERLAFFGTEFIALPLAVEALEAGKQADRVVRRLFEALAGVPPAPASGDVRRIA